MELCLFLVLESKTQLFQYFYISDVNLTFFCAKIRVEGEPFAMKTHWCLSCKQNFKPKTLFSQCFRSVSDLLLSD